MIPLLGFTPDIDPTTPGAIPACENMIPTQRGMRSSPTGVNVPNLSAVPGACRGAVILQKTSGSRRLLAGTQTRIYENTGSTWNAVSATFTGDASNRWSFAQLGDVSLAANKTDQIQYATATTFAAIAGAPKAKILVSVPNFVVALHTADATASATYGTSPDRWWCCAFQDPTSWTANVDTQANTGRLIGGGGELTAGAAFGGGLVAFKRREMFLGQYAGPPTVFDFQRIPGDQGCVGQDAVADIGGALFFVGDDNLWIYDGSRPSPVGADVVRRWFFDSVSAAFKSRCIVRYDASNNLVWTFFPFNTTSTGSPDTALVYHIPSRKWGVVTNLLETGSISPIADAVNYIGGGLTWDTLSSVASSWNTLPSYAWDSEAWQVDGRVLAIVDGNNLLKTMNGPPPVQTLYTHYFGDESSAMSVGRLNCRFYQQPTIGTVVGSTRNSVDSGPALQTISGSLQRGHFDIRQSGKLHQFRLNLAGNTEIGGFSVEAKPAGKR